MSQHYQSPKFFQETLRSQDERLEQEWESARLQHAVRVGRQGLRRLQNRRYGGNSFDALTVSMLVESEMRLEGVAAEYILAVTELIVGQYLRS